MRRLLIVALLAVAPAWAGCAAASLDTQPTVQAPAAAAPSQPLRLPLADDSVKFAVLGDTGTGDSKQQRVADQLTAWRAKFPYEFVIMTGDNIYGTDNARNFRENFEEPYQALLSAGVDFYASLGNHDDPNQRLYKPFNMNGQRYYSFKPKDGVRFFALDTNYVDEAQLKWLEEELMASGSDWKIVFFHHPLYSSGETHGSADLQREQLEPLFVKYGVNVVFAGHEHFYERIKPQKGIAYFTIGNSAKLRRGDLRPTALTAKGWDQGYAFMLVEVVGDELFFQVIDEAGRHVDAGSVRRVGTTPETPSQTTQPVVPGAPAPKKPVAPGEATPKK